MDQSDCCTAGARYRCERMRGAWLLVDDVLIDAYGSRIRRVLVEFDEDTWIAISDSALGKRVGPVQIRDRGVHANVERFPDIVQPNEPGSIGIRTTLQVGDNTVYVLGMPAEYVSSDVRVTLNGEPVPISQEVSSLQRLVCTVHLQNAGMMAVQGRLDHNPEAYLDAVQRPLTMPARRNAVVTALEGLKGYVLTKPGETIEGLGALVRTILGQ